MIVLWRTRIHPNDWRICGHFQTGRHQFFLKCEILPWIDIHSFPLAKFFCSDAALPKNCRGRTSWNSKISCHSNKCQIQIIQNQSCIWHLICNWWIKYTQKIQLALLLLLMNILIFITSIDLPIGMIPTPLDSWFQRPAFWSSANKWIYIGLWAWSAKQDFGSAS